MAKWTVKGVVDDTPKTKQETEQAVLDNAVEKGEIQPEAAGQTEQEVPKIDLDKLGKESEAPNDATVDNAPENKLEQESAEQEVDNDSPIELITDEKSDSEQAGVESSNETPTATQEQEKVLPQEQTQQLPENINKLVEFMQETGGSLEDYVKMNRDVSELPDADVLKEYYAQSKPWDSSDISEYMEDQFTFDEDDDPREIRSKKRAFKEELYNARKFFSTNKEKYYADLKLSSNKEIPEEYKEAYANYSNIKKEQESNKQLQETFFKKTDQVFSSDFKGFDFQVGDNKFRYKVNAVEETKENQSNISNLIKPFLNKKGEMDDAKGYHKALFAARNADKLAQHFYEQGRADALRTSAKEAKNINMEPRAEGTIETKSGQKFRVVSGDSSSKLKIKLKN